MTLPGTLLLVRHHESVWNKAGIWTGSRDIHLTDFGKEMSFKMGEQIRDVRIDQAVTSLQVRTTETLDGMLRALGREDVPRLQSAAINERDYGDFTGKNKLAMRELLGSDEFENMHRSFDYPIPNGESLRVVYERAVPFYQGTILPMLREGKNVLVVSHGNTLRSLMKYIETISDDGIRDVEMPFGSIYLYQVDDEGKVVTRVERHTEDYESNH